MNPSNRDKKGGAMTYTTEQYQGLLAETITINGYGENTIHTYMSRPMGQGPFPGIVLISHALGWTTFHKEMAHRFAYYGYIAMVPDIWCRVGHGEVEDVMSRTRSEGGLHDDQVIGDSESASRYIKSLPISNGKVGIMGSCSGGRHSYLSACRTKGIFDAAVDCWGGNVVQANDKLTPAQPISPLEYTEDLSCPLLGIFGNNDQNPTLEQVNTHEQKLKEHDKEYEFHHYDDAGHGFFYYHMPMYRQQQAEDSWKRIWNFLEKHL